MTKKTKPSSLLLGPIIDGRQLRDEAPKVKRIVLMNMALAKTGSGYEMRRLPEIVENHLSSGQRVIIARLFDVDKDIMPWYGIQKIGWSRERIITLLSPFCNREIGRIDGIVFRELYICEDADLTSN